MSEIIFAYNRSSIREFYQIQLCLRYDYKKRLSFKEAIGAGVNHFYFQIEVISNPSFHFRNHGRFTSRF